MDRSWQAIDRRVTASFAVLAALFVALWAAPGSSATPPPQTGFECRPRPAHIASPPPRPVLPPAAAQAQQAAIQSDEFHPLCPAGEVPYPSGDAEMVKPLPPGGSSAVRPPAGAAARSQLGAHSRRHGRGGSGAVASRGSAEGRWYSWALGWQEFAGSKGVNGVWILQTNEQPYIDYGESLNFAHSLAQLWAIGRRSAEPNCWSTVETGWSESAGVYGDVYPHLFIYAYDCGVRIGEAGGALPWVQSSSVIYPRAALSHNDTFHTYAARLDGNNWWIYYDGQWVGYIPHSAWIQFFPPVVKELQAGGEVETPNYATCTDMGYGGLFGTHPWAAMFESVWYEYNYSREASSAYMRGYESDPSNYNTGHWDAGYPGSEFRYGGPGWC